MVVIVKKYALIERTENDKTTVNIVTLLTGESSLCVG